MFEIMTNNPPVLAQWGRGPEGWGHHMMGFGAMGWAGMFLQGVFLVLILVAAIFAIRWLIRASSGQGPLSGGDRALGILRERFAKGEINSEQFRQMKAELGG